MAPPLHPSMPYRGGAILSPPILRSSGLYQDMTDYQAVQQNNDLRNYHGQSLAIPIRDQSHTSACTAFAGTAVRGALAAKYHLDQSPPEAPDLGDTPSARFAYYYTRQLDGDPTVDAGASMVNACRVYQDYGCAPARFDAWDDARAAADDLAWLNMPPSPGAQGAAADYGISGYMRLSGNGGSLLASILQCLADGYPPLVAITVYRSFMTVRSDGYVPMPGGREQALGGHALACFGSFADRAFTGGGCLVLQNSWGASWGQAGWGYLPWGYVLQGILSEAWTCR